MVTAEKAKKAPKKAPKKTAKKESMVVNNPTFEVNGKVKAIKDLALRSTPDTVSGRVLGVVRTNDILEIATKDVDGFTEIVTESGVQAYVLSAYLTEV